MSHDDALQMTQGANLNHDRALAFGRPVLRALHEDAVLVGYSVTTLNGSDVVVESNHVLRSSLSELQPTSFTVRTSKSWADADWLLHGVDHVMNTNPAFREVDDPQAASTQIISAFTERASSPVEVIIDNHRASGEVLRFGGIELIRLFYGVPTSMITIAASPAVISAGFLTLH